MSNIIFRTPPEFTISTAKFFLKEVENVFKWNNLEKKKEIATWARDADESGRLDEIRERIVEGTDVELPDFIKYIRNFWQKELSN